MYVTPTTYIICMWIAYAGRHRAAIEALKFSPYFFFSFFIFRLLVKFNAVHGEWLLLSHMA